MKNRKRIVSGKKIEWVCIGADLSQATLSLGGLARTTDNKLKSGTASMRFDKTVDYYDRLRKFARPEGLLLELFENMGVKELDPLKVNVCYEEPVAFGQIRGGMSASIKQQCQISGAFVGALLNIGLAQVYEIKANQWRAMVAHDLGITIHHTKWNDSTLCFKHHCHPKNVGKFRAKQWVKEFHPRWDGHWTDIIQSGKLGVIPRPIDSKAKAVQSDDRYEALAMAEFLRRDLKGQT